MLDGSSLTMGVVGFAAAVAALALIERLAKVGFSRIPKLDCDPAPLRTAAEVAYDYARERHLPLASVAERRGASGGAVDWFENHMLHAVPVSATVLKTGSVKVLGARTRARMCAVPSGIANSVDGDPVYGDPMVTAKDFRTYLRWMRTVW
ncbi:MAG: hypothetical protein KGL56_07185 [Alphaproteobacteria bacterium]|nr:hypothetical protein [Alphaproteobacteria bacterium]